MLRAWCSWYTNNNKNKKKNNTSTTTTTTKFFTALNPSNGDLCEAPSAVNIQFNSSKETSNTKKKPGVSRQRGKVQVITTQLIIYSITLSPPVFLSPSLPPFPSPSPSPLSPLSLPHSISPPITKTNKKRKSSRGSS